MIRRQTVPHQIAGDVAQITHRHQEDQRLLRIAQTLPIDCGTVLRRIFVTRDDREHRTVIAVRHRNAGIRRSRKRGTHARNDLELDPCCMQRLRFFAAAAKEKRVAALQAHDRFPGARLFDHERFDLVLRYALGAAAFACIDAFACRRHKIDDRVRGERVIE